MIKSFARGTADGPGNEICLSKAFYRLVHDSAVPWTIDSSYVPRRMFRNCPHTMIVLKHDAKPEDKLFRGEVLSILEAMATRLGLPKFTKHVNVPVGQCSCLPFSQKH